MKYKRTDNVWFPDEERDYYVADAFQWNGDEKDIPVEFRDDFLIDGKILWFNDDGAAPSMYFVKKNGVWKSCAEGFFKLMFEVIDFV